MTGIALKIFNTVLIKQEMDSNLRRLSYRQVEIQEVQYKQRKSAMMEDRHEFQGKVKRGRKTLMFVIRVWCISGNVRTPSNDHLDPSP